jgi:hypothetical protein
LLKDESISQYKLKRSTLVTELIQFSNTLKDDEEKPSILEKLKDLLKSQTPIRDEVGQVESGL